MSKDISNVRAPYSRRDTEKVIAKLVLWGVPDMTPKTRKFLSVWLREQAEDVIKEGDQYSRRFVARYWK